MKPEGRRPEGFIEATSAHKKVPLYYGKIIPPPLLSPPYSIQFYHTTRRYRVVYTFGMFFVSHTVFCYDKTKRPVLKTALLYLYLNMFFAKEHEILYLNHI